jgi:ankyrin repeat protein
MYYRTFSLILILLIMSLIWSSQLLSNTKGELNNDLIEAATNGQTEKVLDLIKAGADVNAKSNSGVTALMRAAYQGHTDTVKALIGAGADVDAKDNINATALMYAALNGHTDTVKALIEAKADVNAKNKNGYTALMLADKKGHTEIVDLLKSGGANPISAVDQGKLLVGTWQSEPFWVDPLVGYLVDKVVFNSDGTYFESQEAHGSMTYQKGNYYVHEDTGLLELDVKDYEPKKQCLPNGSGEVNCRKIIVPEKSSGRYQLLNQNTMRLRLGSLYGNPIDVTYHRISQ